MLYAQTEHILNSKTLDNVLNTTNGQKMFFSLISVKAVGALKLTGCICVIPKALFVKSKLLKLLLLLNELGYSSSQWNWKDATVITFDFVNFLFVRYLFVLQLRQDILSGK